LGTSTVPPIPEWLNWVLAIFGLISIVAFIVDKSRKLHRYLRERHQDNADQAHSRRDYVLGAILALLCALLWSISYVSLSAVTRQTSVLVLNTVLMGSASVFLYAGAILSQPRPLDPKKTRRAFQRTWGTGHLQFLILANLGNFVLSVWALRYISASQATALNNMSPALLAAVLVMSGRLRLSLSTAIAFVVVLLGVWITAAQSDLRFQSGPALIGSLIALGAGASFASWAYLMEGVEVSIERTHLRMKLLAAVFFGSYAVLVTITWLMGHRAQLSPEALTVLGLNGVRVAAVYYLFQLAVKRAGPLLPSVVVVLQVPLTMLWDHVWLKTVIPTQLFLGAGLIMLGIVAFLSDELARTKTVRRTRTVGSI
jgi:drug/metabolite transporter (DMT)-like permease